MASLVRFHAASGAVAMAIITSFMGATIVSEAFFGPGAIAATKRFIVLAIPLLVAALAAAGASGFRLGRGWQSATVARKRRRMPIIAGNGIIVLVPAALFLSSRAGAGLYDTAFYAVQIAELAAGAVNLVLLGRNFRDGLSMR
ncbi:MAG: hypothetical protein R3D02_08255 [Hyphomicrobiales bacterium]